MSAPAPIALAIEEAAQRHPSAEPLIAHTALLAPEPIPLFLFAEALDKLGEPLASTLARDARKGKIGMQTITNEQLRANARKAYDEQSLTAQQERAHQ